MIGQWGGYPKANEASSGYLVEHDGFKLLIDCGSAVLSKLQTYIAAEELDAVILSHYHPDHVADIGVLQHALLISKYMNQGGSNLPIFGHRQDEAAFETLTYKDITTGVAYHPEQTLHIGPFEIDFLQTKHPVPCFAMRVEAGGQVLVYTADSAYLNAFDKFSENADVLLCECNFYKGMDGAAAGHMTSEEAGSLAKKSNVGKLILTHLPHFGDHEQLKAEAAEQFPGDILLASQGLKVFI